MSGYDDAVIEANKANVGARIAQRRQAANTDASDANTEVLARQLAEDPGPVTWTKLDARKNLSDLADGAAEQVPDQGPKISCC